MAVVGSGCLMLLPKGLGVGLYVIVARRIRMSDILLTPEEIVQALKPVAPPGAGRIARAQFRKLVKWLDEKMTYNETAFGDDRILHPQQWRELRKTAGLEDK